MAVYTTANFVIACIREIIQNAKLNQEEYERLASIYQESTRESIRYRKKVEEYFSVLEQNQIQLFKMFIDSFDYDLSSGKNYDRALNAIICFADVSGIELRNVSFESFQNDIRNRKTLILK